MNAADDELRSTELYTADDELSTGLYTELEDTGLNMVDGGLKVLEKHCVDAKSLHLFHSGFVYCCLNIPPSRKSSNKSDEKPKSVENFENGLIWLGSWNGGLA